MGMPEESDGEYVGSDEDQTQQHQLEGKAQKPVRRSKMLGEAETYSKRLANRGVVGLNCIYTYCTVYV